MKQKKQATKSTKVDEGDVVVHLLDWDKIEADVTERVHKNGVLRDKYSKIVYNKEVKFYFAYKYAIVESPRFIVITNECVGIMENVRDEYTFGVYLKLSDGRMSLAPSFNSSYSREELNKYKTGKTISLREWMADRWHYNSRIDSNIAGVMNYLNGK